MVVGLLCPPSLPSITLTLGKLCKISSGLVRVGMPSLLADVETRGPQKSHKVYILSHDYLILKLLYRGYLLLDYSSYVLKEQAKCVVRPFSH